MKNFFLTKLLRYLCGRLDGYKTKIGGAGMILTGMAGLVQIMYPDSGLPELGIEASLGFVSGGFVALGLGGKAEKLKKAIEASPVTGMSGTSELSERIERTDPR